MNRIYLLLTLVIVAFISLKAQPVLTSANTNPQVGESFKLNFTDYVAPGNGGANATWNFSGLKADSSATATYVTPASTPFASSFPGANLAIESNSNYAYYIANSSSFSMAGVTTNSTTKIPYSNTEQLLTFPFTINAAYTDSFAGKYTVNNLTFTRSGTVKVAADGYGSLVLPFGTLKNVLRVMQIENYKDELFGLPPTSYVDSVYEWFLPGVHYPVMSITNLYLDGSPFYSGGSYLDPSNISVNDIAGYQAHFSVFPNPASESVKVSYLLNSSSSIRLSLTNVLGQTLSELTNTVQAAGNHDYTVDLKSLPKGLYLLRLEIGAHAITHKLMVE